MAAIDEIDSAITDSNNRLDSLRAQRARHQERVAVINNLIDAELNRKDALRKAKRDLGDAWTPAP